MWEELGSPDLSEIESVHTGDLMERRHGLRKDDFVEIQLDARSLRDDDENWVRGRLLSSGKSSIELLTTNGEHVYLAREIIVKVVLIAHTRPAYIDDKELLEFERADQKRRSNLHEKVEKKTKGNDDSHLWG
ncbi:MAG: hypothetical protein DWC02_00795 [Candidatus Poseidoniales archaeon]|nr:MAG: hypothetical protein DWC02_00795 [Candidatus Poseidoniales archaeon]